MHTPDYTCNIDGRAIAVSFSPDNILSKAMIFDALLASYTLAPTYCVCYIPAAGAYRRYLNRNRPSRPNALSRLYTDTVVHAAITHHLHRIMCQQPIRHKIRALQTNTGPDRHPAQIERSLHDY